MIRIFLGGLAVLSAVMTLSLQVRAHEGFELGMGLGHTRANSPDSFRELAQQGDAHLYWLGYGFNKKWGLEIGYDQLDFDGMSTRIQAISISSVYNFFSDYTFHPKALLGIGTSEITSDSMEKTTSLHVKGSLSFEYDFKYIALGAGFNYFHLLKIQNTPEINNAGVLVPAVYLICR